MQVLRELRPDAVGLVDSFAIPDYVLDSSLGRFDGDVYRSESLQNKAPGANIVEDVKTDHCLHSQGFCGS